MQPTVQHFKILGISPTSTLDEIRRAYRKLSLRYHPDKTPRREDHEKFKEINIAYETIRDYYQENGQKNSQPIPNTNTEHNSHQKPHYNTGPYSTYRFTTSSTTTDKPITLDIQVLGLLIIISTKKRKRITANKMKKGQPNVND